MSLLLALYVLMYSQLIIEIYASHLARWSGHLLLIVKLINRNQAQTLGHIPLCLWKPHDIVSSTTPAAFIFYLVCIYGLFCCYVWGIHCITEVINNCKLISSLHTLLLTQTWTRTSVTVLIIWKIHTGIEKIE